MRKHVRSPRNELVHSSPTQARASLSANSQRDRLSKADWKRCYENATLATTRELEDELNALLIYLNVAYVNANEL